MDINLLPIVHAAAYAIICFGVLMLCTGFSLVYEAIRRWQYWLQDETENRPDNADEPTT